jgi:mono/diheme cytochrome c family protein
MRRKNIGLGSLVAVLAVLGGCLPEVPASGWRSGTSGRGSGSGAPGSKGGSDDPSAGTGAFADGLVPEFGTTVRSADPPPPLSGGTIAMAPDGKTIVAADPDRDLVYVVDYHAPSTLRTVALYHHDEPGRVVVDTSNRAHVALRRAGAFVTIDLATATVIARRDVCSAPRGIAHDPDTDLVHVACAGGEIVTFPAGGGPELRRRFVTRDLRDVVAVPGALIVSTFRDARTYRLDDATNVALERYRPQNVLWGTPAVAWRMVALPGGKLPTRSADDDNGEAVLMAAQRVPASGDDGSVAPAPPSAPAAYYAGTGVADPCNPNGPAPLILESDNALYLPEATLPVDAAASWTTIAVVAAANAHTPALPQLVFVDRWTARSRTGDHFACQIEPSTLALPGLQLTSVVFADDATVIALSREPAALVVVHVDLELDEGPTEIARIPLSAESREDTGHAIFHSNTGFGVACASCHPDGRDDGHSWKSIELGARRTPSLLGTLAGTAPYHWSGEAPDLTALMKLTFQSRMHGPALTDDRFDAIGGWLRALPAPPVAAPTDAAAAIRGQALFEGAAACSTCHSGTMRTNNATLDVSTGGAFQVPSLIGVSWRSPFLHDGSAPTVRALLERSHGRAALGDSQMHDLEAYVATF